MATQLTTWDELRADLASIKDTLAAAQQRALDVLAKPEWDDSGANYVRAYRAAAGGLEGALPRVEALIALLAASAASPLPARALGAEETGRIIQAAIAWQRRRDQLPGGLEPQDEADELEQAVKAVLAAAGPVRSMDPVDQIADAFAARKPAEQTEPLAREVRTIRGFKVEFELDEALGTWRFHCAERRIGGAGGFTLEDALEAAEDAIADSLQPVPEKADRLNAIAREERRRAAEASEPDGGEGEA